jgi:hypothetical protein
LDLEKGQQMRGAVGGDNKSGGDGNGTHFRSSGAGIKGRRRSGEHGHHLNSSSNEGGASSPLSHECLVLNISPDLGERIMVSGDRCSIEEVFPETGTAVMDGRSSVAWQTDARHVIRFPLNGYCKLNSIQAITRLLNSGYRLEASHGGGVDSQQFSEYLFVRRGAGGGSGGNSSCST